MIGKQPIVQHTQASYQDFVPWRIHPEKGILELATAFKGIPARIRNDFKLTIRGPWRAEQGGGQIYFSKIKKWPKVAKV